MRTHPRLRSFSKWIGASASVLLATLWLTCVYMKMGYQSNPCESCQFVAGCAHFVGCLDDPSGKVEEYLRQGRSESIYHLGLENVRRTEGWQFYRIRPAFGRTDLGLVLPVWHRQKIWGTISQLRVRIPLWLPFLLVTIPTVWLWYRDRRRPTEGHCPNCHYNMTGNQSGKCPECGTPTPKPEPAAPEPAPNVRTRSASAGQHRVPEQVNAATSPDDFR